MTPAKDLYLSHETYIPITRNLYTYHLKPIYLSSETYIPFARAYPNQSEPSELTRLIPINHY